MKRDIKFRVWANRENRWCGTHEYVGCEWGLYNVTDIPVRVNLQLGMGMSSQDIEIYRREAFTMEQFTGLKDTNGRDIYDGDIISVREYENEKCEPEIGLVTWGEYGDEEYVENLETWMIHWVSNIWKDDKVVGQAVDPEAWPTPLSCAVRSGGVRYSRGKGVYSPSFQVIGNIHENPELLTS